MISSVLMASFVLVNLQERTVYVRDVHQIRIVKTMDQIISAAKIWMVPGTKSAVRENLVITVKKIVTAPMEFA